MRSRKIVSSNCSGMYRPPPVRCERIWDNDLKRYLTENEINHAEVFLSEREAVKIILPQSERVRKEMLQLTQEKKDLIEQRIGWKFPETSLRGLRW